MSIMQQAKQNLWKLIKVERIIILKKRKKEKTNYINYLEYYDFRSINGK